MRKQQRDKGQKNKKKRKKKYIIRIGTWNVRTLLKAGKMEEAARELQKYDIEILILQESRWSEEGSIENEHYIFYYSGKAKQGKNGTKFIIDKAPRTKIKKMKAANCRLSYITIDNKQANITVLNAYAPTEEAKEEEKKQS